MTDDSSMTALAETVWDRFQAVGFTPDFGPDLSRFLIALYRRLAAQGQAITANQIEELAETTNVPPELAHMFVEQAGERDEDGAVTGIVGLSLNKHPHKFLVHGHELTTWCALDPMLIAPAMTEAVELESDDPTSGESIRVSVDPSGVQIYEPTTAVVSIVIPKSGATDNLESVWGMFCHQVHFFASRESGEQFFSDNDDEVYFLTIEEAFELGQLTFGPVLEQL
ncbi:MAG: organomercurial lyase MerB [Acidimicrobiia bacterium]|nr:MAG: organomercurial lyase MerB [Acidimicrobiia bacterium]